jgi:hypothetical protein
MGLDTGDAAAIGRDDTIGIAGNVFVEKDRLFLELYDFRGGPMRGDTRLSAIEHRVRAGFRDPPGPFTFARYCDLYVGRGSDGCTPLILLASPWRALWSIFWSVTWPLTSFFNAAGARSIA